MKVLRFASLSLMALALRSSPAAAQVAVNVPDASAQPGETVTVTVETGAADGVEALDLRLGFDTSILEIVDVRQGAALDGVTDFIHNPDEAGGRIVVGTYFLEPASVPEGVLVEIDFEVSDAAAGQTPIDLTLASYNESAIPVVPEPVSGGDPTDGTLTIVVPEIDVSPPALDFGEVIIREPETLDVTVRNLGDAPLEVTGVALAAGTTPEFSIPALALPANVAPSGTLVIAVTYDPTDRGADAGELEIRSDDRDEGLVTVSLSGDGIGKEIDVVPAELEFGEVNQGESATLGLTVNNTGRAALTLTRVELSGDSSAEFTLEPVAVPLVIAGESSDTIRVTYSPIDAGPDTGTLEIDSNDLDEPNVEVPLSGVGLGPQGVPVIRGDSNIDLAVNLSDAVHILNALFLGIGRIECPDASDANSDSQVNLSDAVAILNVLFLGIGNIAPPNVCGEEPFADPETCERTRCP